MDEVEFWARAAEATRKVVEEGVPPPRDWIDVELAFLRRLEKARLKQPS